jgi:hypothetical protein
MEAFAKALLEGKPSPIDVYQALDYCVPGILAVDSKANAGMPVPVPDFRPKPLPEGIIPAISRAKEPATTT